MGVREALGPVIDWYQSSDEQDRNEVEIVRDVVADLQEDRTACINAQQLAQDAKRLCEEGHPISAFNLAIEILDALGVGPVRPPTSKGPEQPHKCRPPDLHPREFICPHCWRRHPFGPVTTGAW